MREMKMVFQWLMDWAFNYMMAWILILSFPLWLPIYLARKLNKWVRDG